jgi:nucleotide-binding universal stress UspA family protein
VDAEESPFVDNILHPSDFSEGSEVAFDHALAIALYRRARLTIFHAERGGGHGEWDQFPGVRDTLSRWHLLPAGTSRDDVFDKLSLDVRKVQTTGKRPLQAIVDYVAAHDVQLIVLTTEGRMGLSRLVHPSLAERMARLTGAWTLIVPKNARGFVTRDGRMRLARLLVPVALEPDPMAAVEAAARTARNVAKGSVEIYLIHVGKQSPKLTLPTVPGCSWRTMATEGDVVDTIVEMAEAHDVDLIVMATAGPKGILDSLRGSVTERVVRRAPFPVLAVPARPASTR